MIPTCKTAIRIELEFDDGSTMEFKGIKAKFKASENCRMHGSQIEDTWDEFYISWFLPICVSSEAEDSVVAQKVEEPECVDIQEFLNDPNFAGIQDNVAYYYDKEPKRLAS